MSLARVGSAAKSALVVGLEAEARARLAKELQTMRWHVEGVRGGAEALDCLERCTPGAVVVDDWLPDLEVNEFVAKVTAMYPQVEMLRIGQRPSGRAGASALWTELNHALRAMESVAGTRQMSLPQLMPVAVAPVTGEPVARVMERLEGRALRDVKAVGGPIAIDRPPATSPGVLARPGTRAGARIKGLIGESGCMQEMCRLIGLVARHRATVLIEGETGTGKELVAQAVHRLSPRAGKPMAVLNCAAIPEALLEAELFGHTRGAFTGAVNARTGRIEAAQGGTLFLDEIGEMPLALQAKMLRFLECGELQRIGDNETLRVDVRIVAATHQDLQAGAAAGKFRLDLYHRLAVFPIEVPALRERREDIALLSEHLLERLGGQSHGGSGYRVHPAAMEQMEAYDWPGNVRELGHTLERATILADGGMTLGVEEVLLGVGRGGRSESAQ